MNIQKLIPCLGLAALFALPSMAMQSSASNLGSPAIPVGDTDIGLGSKDSTVIVAPGTLVEMFVPNSPEHKFTEIAFFAQQSQVAHQYLLPNDRIPVFQYRVPDYARGRVRLTVIGKDDHDQQLELQAANVVIDPKAFCHAHVIDSSGTEATLGVSTGVTGAYIFADGLFVGKAEGTGDKVTIPVGMLPPGDTTLTVISENQYGDLYAPCQMPASIKPRFTLSISSPSVEVTKPTDSATLTASCPADLHVAKIRFVFDGVPVGTVNGNSGSMAFALKDTGSGEHQFGVQGITEGGTMFGVESLPLKVKNVAADRRIAIQSLDDKLSDCYRQLRVIDQQLDDAFNGVINASNTDPRFMWGRWGYWENWTTPTTGLTLISFKNAKGYYTIPIIDGYGANGQSAFFLQDARNIILRRAAVELTIAQIQIAQKRPDLAKQTLLNIRDETYGTWMQRRVDALLRTLK